MRRVLLSLSILCCALAAAAPAAVAQDFEPVRPAASEAPAPAGAGGAVAAQPASPGTTQGLPARVAPPRTMRAYWHVFIAFAVTWLLLFGYAISLGRRFGRLDDEVRRLGRAAE